MLIQSGSILGPDWFCYCSQRLIGVGHCCLSGRSSKTPGCVEQCHCTLPGDLAGVRAKGDSWAWAAQFLTCCHGTPQHFKAFWKWEVCVRAHVQSQGDPFRQRNSFCLWRFPNANKTSASLPLVSCEVFCLSWTLYFKVNSFWEENTQKESNLTVCITHLPKLS